MRIRSKTVFLRYSSSFQAKAKTWGTVVLCAGVIGLFEYFGAAHFFRSVGEVALSPFVFASARSVALFERPFAIAANARGAAQTIQEYEIQYSQALAQLEELERLKQENQALRALIENTDRRLTDSVITVPLVSYAYPAIAAGKSHRVQPGDLLFVADSLVGIVTDVSQQFSRVHLLFQDDSHPLVVQTETGVEGILVGDGKQMLLTEVGATEELVVGQRVSTTGQPGVEKGLLIGKITKIIVKPESAVQAAVVQPVVSFYTTEIVEVRR